MINIQYLKYALEVAQCGSINKAAEKLYIAQPNLSRAIKELEKDFNVSIFERTAQGMILTPEGESFISYAKSILKQLEDMEQVYKGGEEVDKQTFSISVPRANYISYAFARFSKNIDANSSVELFYKETNSARAINNILSADFKMGIIRYASMYDKYFKKMLEEKEMIYNVVTEFNYVLVMNKDSDLAKIDDIHYQDLEPYIEIAHGDPYVPSLPLSVVKKEELPDNIRRRIFVYERASQFDILSTNEQTFMWVSPIPPELLERYGLIQKKCSDNTKLYKDVLIYNKDYKLTELDRMFINELAKAKKEFM